MFLLNRKTLLIGGIFLFIAFVYILTQGEEKETKEFTPIPTVTLRPTIIKRPLGFLDISSAPTIPPGEGFGIDINSQIVKTSELEIQKIYPLLPYSTSYVLSTGVKVSIVIPQKELQDNPWTLLIHVFGIDYQLSPADENYLLMKNSFKEAASDTLSFLQENGADPNKIFIIWGDKAIIQNVTSSWLREP